MDFGKVDDLSNIDFTLPPDDEGTTRLLVSLKKSRIGPRLYVGCAKWGRKDWVGKLYPKGAKEKDYLDHYTRQFNSIELNATHYKMPDSASILKWGGKASGDFRFCPKFPQLISHIRRLKGAEELTDSFLSAVSGFGPHLGPCFLQLPPNYGPRSMGDIIAYLEKLPRDMEICLELRHPDWFSDRKAFGEIVSAMEENGIGAVITDAAGRRDCVHQRLTTPLAFIRFVGNGLHPTDFTRIDDWVYRLKEWMDKGLRDVYFFMHQHDELHTPEAVYYTVQKFNEVCGTALALPELSDPQAKLDL